MGSERRDLTTQQRTGGPRLCLLISLLINIAVVIICTSPTTTMAYPTSRFTTRRWFNPCHGDDPIDLSSSPASTSTTTSGSLTTPTSSVAPSSVDLASRFHTISTKATRLKRHVRELKDLYVAQRFRDNSIVQDLEQMGVRLDGMPEAAAPTIAHVSNVDVIQTVHRTYEHLARVAVFVDQARIGESLAINEQYSYEHQFERIENHHEHGLYWLLCAVHQLIYVTGNPVADHVIDAVSRMRVVEVDRNALRHTRDYLVLRDFERILARLGVEFTSLRHSHRRRHHHRAK